MAHKAAITTTEGWLKERRRIDRLAQSAAQARRNRSMARRQVRAAEKKAQATSYEFESWLEQVTELLGGTLPDLGDEPWDAWRYGDTPEQCTAGMLEEQRLFEKRELSERRRRRMARS